jgi:Winged helix DNA-binding domain
MQLSDAQVRRLRSRAQRLGPRGRARHDAAQVVRDVCGVQAQDTAAAALAVRVRSTGLTLAGVEHALIEARSIVRTWAMRGTLHWLAAEDVGWLLALLGPSMQAGNRRRRLQLGLDDASIARGVRLLRSMLAEDGPLTRDEIVARLGKRGLTLQGQARPQLLYYAALDRVICYGAERGHEPTYVLLEDWLGRDSTRQVEREVALSELARRYIAAFGPARPADLAVWSGVSVGEARTAWASVAAELREVTLGGQAAWLLRGGGRGTWLEDGAQAEEVVRLLPSFDTYLLGYRDRSLTVAPEHVRRVNAGGGMLRPTVLTDGRAVGTWRLERRGTQAPLVGIEPFGKLSAASEQGVDDEVGDLERFLGVPVRRV